MPKGLVVYDSATGNTEKMAMAISRGMKKAGLTVEVKRVKDASLDDLIDANAIVLGSPTYFANVSNKMKRFIDKSIKIYPDKLKNKVGAVFTSSEGVGSEMTLLSLIVAMLLHRMVIIGHQSGDFGAISFKEPDNNCVAECEAFGERIADFTKVIASR
ncbi:MAG: flavodoxin family protein [Dehalococcoidia bacterium]|nr:MAG: flavodoxin family protein [Dehalococcoidia bacterium]